MKGILLVIVITAALILIIEAIYEIKYRNKDKKKKTNTITVEEINIDERNIFIPKEIYDVPITELRYRKKLLLTKNEWNFYKTLKPIAENLGYTVLAKIRVADIVEPIPTKDRSEWQKNFNKISNKHIDFVLAKPENLKIVLLIELDDSTHNYEQIERDKFINELYKKTGYKLLRTRGTDDLKNRIINIIEEK